MGAGPKPVVSVVISFVIVLFSPWSNVMFARSIPNTAVWWAVLVLSLVLCAAVYYCRKETGWLPYRWAYFLLVVSGALLIFSLSLFTSWSTL